MTTRALVYLAHGPARAASAAGLAAVLLLPAGQALGAVKTRLFTFENGAPGSPANTALNSVTGPFKDVPDATFPVPTDFFDTGGPAIPGGTLLGDWVSQTYDPSPDFFAAATAPTYVNVANGSPLDSPAPNSNVGLQFTSADNTMTGQGFRGTYIADAAIASNAPAVADTNVFTSFTVLSQGWVRPDPAGQGASQVVWSLGTDLGAPRITADGFWEMANVSVIPDTKSTRPVNYGAWTHVAILRTGGSATLYINGSVAVAAQNFFGAFPLDVTLGAGLVGEPFSGVIDNFAISGIGGLGFSIATDIDFFADTGLPQPSGIVGDVNQDGAVNQTDYNIWSTNVGFNNTFGVGDLTTLIRGDLDSNGKIDFFDYRIIARQAAASGVTLVLGVPEPAAGALIVVAGTLGWAVRRRYGV